MKIAFDVGGVLSKYPHVLRPWLRDLCFSHDVDTRIYVISDMHPKEKIIEMLGFNDFGFIPEANIYSADYKTHGEKCKAILCKELNIDILVDDFMGYVADGTHIRLLVMPNTNEPYYHDSWKTDGAEGTFGRRTISCEATWTKDLVSFRLSVDPQRVRYERSDTDYVMFPVACNLSLKFKNMEYWLIAQNVSHDDFVSISNTKCEMLHNIAKWENDCEASESKYLRGTLMILGNRFIVAGMSGEQVAEGDK